MVMPVGYYSEVKLTGRQRVRRGWFGKLILQVEVEQIYITPPGVPPHEHCPPYQSDNQPCTKWRDATAADVGLETAVLKSVLNVE